MPVAPGALHYDLSGQGPSHHTRGELDHTGAAPAPGIGHLPEDKQCSGLGSGQEGPCPGRAVRSWALAGAAMGIWAVGGVGEDLGNRGAD